MGEGMPNDANIMPLIDQCSIACGGHAGDFQSMHRTVNLAKKYEVEIGAHPSYPDRENFGRKSMNLTDYDLLNSLKSQVKTLRMICSSEGTTLSYIKPHGALYNDAVSNREIAEIIIKLIQDFPNCKLMAPWNSELDMLAKEEGIPVMYEGFADRRYHENLALVPRAHHDSVIHQPTKALSQVLSIANDHHIETVEKVKVPFRAHTFCVHGDNPAVLDILKLLKNNQ